MIFIQKTTKGYQVIQVSEPLGFKSLGLFKSKSQAKKFMEENK